VQFRPFKVDFEMAESCVSGRWSIIETAPEDGKANRSRTPLSAYMGYGNLCEMDFDLVVCSICFHDRMYFMED
jgi:hypothetical protein